MTVGTIRGLDKFIQVIGAVIVVRFELVHSHQSRLAACQRNGYRNDAGNTNLIESLIDRFPAPSIVINTTGPFVIII